MGRDVAAAEALGVNYRTMMAYYDSRRMRQALEEFRDAGGVVGDEPGDVDGDDPDDIRSESLERRVAALEDENRHLRDLETISKRCSQTGQGCIQEVNLR